VEEEGRTEEDDDVQKEGDAEDDTACGRSDVVVVGLVVLVFACILALALTLGFALVLIAAAVALSRSRRREWARLLTADASRRTAVPALSGSPARHQGRLSGSQPQTSGRAWLSTVTTTQGHDCPCLAGRAGKLSPQGNHRFVEAVLTSESLRRKARDRCVLLREQGS
jgi:hypothetical protein